MNQYIYKNTKNNKYLKIIDWTFVYITEVDDIEDAEKYEMSQGLFGDNFDIYERVCYKDEKKLIRKKKLAQILQKKLI